MFSELALLTINVFTLYPNFQTSAAVVTCYTSEVGQTDDTPLITASGRKLEEGDRVAANNCLPFGTTIMVEDEIFIVDDKMNKRYNCGRVDLWFGKTKADKKRCLEFGRQKKIIYILDKYGPRKNP